MAQNLASPDSHEIPLTVLGGEVTYIDPTSLPQGVSPDCSDVQFAPGGVFSRDGFERQFANPTYPNTTCTYAKSYISPTGTIYNLYLYSNGGVTVEYPQTTPGIETALLDNNGNPVFLTPGSYMKSITAFGREYLAPSDKLHGSDVPLQLAFDAAGNPQVDRVTSDGPGASPTIASIPLPPVATAIIPTSGPTIVSATTTDLNPVGGYYTTTTVILTGPPTPPLTVGVPVTISGNTNAFFNINYGGIIQVIDDVTFKVTQYSYTLQTGTGGAVSGTGTATMYRSNNVVTAQTAAPHNLQIGYQAQITGFTAAAIGGGIASIVINNENLPGLATVTTNSAHDLQPENLVSIAGVEAVAVGTSITSIKRAGQIVTVVMSAATGLAPGGIVTVAGVPTASFNTGFATVINVGTTVLVGDTFSFSQIDVDASDVSGTGTISVNWPIPPTPTPTFFEVQSAPTPTTFQIAINYADSPAGGWTTGTVTFAWNGTFYVLSVFNPNTPGGTDYLGFSYQQNGPNATTTQFGTVTPYGQAAPGNKQMAVFFIDRQGGITAYSPPIPFVANGGQYYSVSDIPIGPSPTTVARGIAFTGADGAYLFYIPSPPQINGLVVGTATQINDNTTTSAIFDFGDPTLFAATGISTQRNNLANQLVLEGALGFAFYGSRLITYGQRNIVDNLLNMGFGGGYLPSSIVTYGAAQPTGWTVSATVPGALAVGHFGEGYQLSVTSAKNGAILSQSFYEDYTGAPIGQANTQYKIRAWLKPSAIRADINFIVKLNSASASFSSTATINGATLNTAGSWLEANFTLITPSIIPTDMMLSFGATAGASMITLLVDDLNLIYSETPFLNSLIGSYINNPEGLDGVSGVFGPSDDTHQPLALGVIRSNLYILTRDPGGRLHQTSQGNTEPSGWVVDEVGQNCGTVSTFGLTVSQANDATGGGGEEWFAWYSASGPRIFGGEFPFKIAQELMRRKGRVPPGAPNDLTNINPAAQTSVWALNDPEQKVMYFGVPMNSSTAPSTIWTLNYLGCETAEEIANANPVHRAINSGKMIANDLGRKWSPWQRTMNGAALMFREEGYLEPLFFGGNGLTPNTSTANAFGNVYALNPDLLTDDDYNLIVPYYTTYAFPDADLAQALGIGGGLKMCSAAYGLISGTGILNISIQFNLLSKTWRIAYQSTAQSPLQVDADNDTEWGCGQATGKRFWFRFWTTPLTGTNNGFELNNWTVAIKKNARMPFRGSNRS